MKRELGMYIRLLVLGAAGSIRLTIMITAIRMTLAMKKIAAGSAHEISEGDKASNVGRDGDRL